MKNDKQKPEARAGKCLGRELAAHELGQVMGGETKPLSPPLSSSTIKKIEGTAATTTGNLKG